MSVSELDLELLESYLDGELSPGEHEALRKRLSSEPELAATIDELRTQRAMRQQFFATIEPDETSVAQVMRSVQREANREIIWAERNRTLRWVGSLAACLLVGFGVGRMTGLTTVTPPTASSGDNRTFVIPGTIVNPNANLSASANRAQAGSFGLVSDQVNPLRFDGPRINVPKDFNITQINPNMIVPRLVDYQVRLMDRAGNEVRRFESPQEFERFVREQMGATSQPSVIGR